MHSYLLFTPTAYLVHSKKAETLALSVAGCVTTCKAAVLHKQSAIKFIPSLDLHQQPAAAPAATTRDHERCVAHIVATVKQMAAVRREALHLALLHRTNAATSGILVNSKTWRQLINGMIEKGEIKQTAILCGAKQVGVIVDSSVETDGTDVSWHNFIKSRTQRQGRERLIRRPKAGRKSSVIESISQPRLKRTRHKEPSNCSSKCGRRQCETESNRIIASDCCRLQHSKEFSERLSQSQERFSDLSIELRLQLDRIFKVTAAGSLQGSREEKSKRRVGQNIPDASIRSSVPIKPLARRVIKIIVDTHRRGHASGLEVTAFEIALAVQNSPLGDVVRVSWPVVSSWLLRRGWVAFSDGKTTDSTLVLPATVILQSCNFELTSFHRFVDLFCAAEQPHIAPSCLRCLPAPKSPRALAEESFQSAFGGGHVGYMLAALRQAISFKPLSQPQPWGRWFYPLGHERSPLDVPGWISMRHLRYISSWRQAVTSDFELWTSPDCKQTHFAIRQVLRRVIFVHCLNHVGITADAIAQKRILHEYVPDLDHLEISALLLHLCDGGILRADRDVPFLSGIKHVEATIFNVPDNTLNQSEPRAVAPEQRAISALTAQAVIKTPRFFLNHDAIENFLKRDEADVLMIRKEKSTL
mmetsp:Transcript_32563/g.98021  ORF Transcript_32563/g.98021 Transcript_32563/m.98021 type:complete len:643 (+) Transcript_32563:1156-3084(+)